MYDYDTTVPLLATIWTLAMIVFLEKFRRGNTYIGPTVLYISYFITIILVALPEGRDIPFTDLFIAYSVYSPGIMLLAWYVEVAFIFLLYYIIQPDEERLHQIFASGEI